MDGISATKMIHEICEKSKVVFISADETVREAALEAGADKFQVKPVRAPALFEIIAKLTKTG